MINLVIFGAPGSGKGTQSEKLISRFGLHHISTGQVLRNHIQRGTDLGKTADAIISKGNLIPDDLMVKVLAQELDNAVAAGSKGVIFDGFPRTVAQAEALEKLLNERKTSLSGVIGLEVPENLLMDRMLERGKREGRADDNPETISKRLDVYHNSTAPLRKYYNDKNIYLPIKGDGSVDDIAGDIAQVVNKIQSS